MPATSQGAAGSAYLQMIDHLSCFYIAAKKGPSETVLLALDTQVTQAPTSPVPLNRDRQSDIFNEFRDDDDALEAPLSGALGQVLQKILSEVRSCHDKMDQKMDSVMSEVADISERLKSVEKSVAELKEGQILGIDANQHFKTQVANEVKKISQQQDIGESM